MRASTSILVFVLLVPVVCRAEPLEGFSFVDIRQGWIEWVYSPRMNDCGDIVFSWGSSMGSGTEVYLYDNGKLTRLTDNDISDSAPDINNDGTVVWAVGYDGFDSGEIVLRRDGEVNTLGSGMFPTIGDQGYAVWGRGLETGCGTADVDIYLFDGEDTAQLTYGGESNQTMVINDHGTIVWTLYDFCPDPWVSSTMLRQPDGTVYELPSVQESPTAPSINNMGQVAWGGPAGIELWEEGTTTLLTSWGRVPMLNDSGDIFFIRWHEHTSTWQGWYYTPEGEYHQLTDDSYRNTDGDINNSGEVVWLWANVDAGYRGVRMMRRIRTGEADFDGDVDLSDFAAFQNCMTGEGDFDRLCDCRFLDIDHDRDVDLDDYGLFQTAITGPISP